jgi:uncharacterized protein YihD (DUF1040 family)
MTGMKLRKLVVHSKEQLIIKLINKLFNGVNSKELYKLVKKIDNESDFKLIDINGDECNTVYYGNLWQKDIATLLNDNMIYMRNDKMWKSSDISNILKKYNDNVKTHGINV